MVKITKTNAELACKVFLQAVEVFRVLWENFKKFEKHIAEKVKKETNHEKLKAYVLKWFRFYIILRDESRMIGTGIKSRAYQTKLPYKGSNLYVQKSNDNGLEAYYYLCSVAGLVSALAFISFTAFN